MSHESGPGRRTPHGDQRKKKKDERPLAEPGAMNHESVLSGESFGKAYSSLVSNRCEAMVSDRSPPRGSFFLAKKKQNAPAVYLFLHKSIKSPTAAGKGPDYSCAIPFRAGSPPWFLPTSLKQCKTFNTFLRREDTRPVRNYHRQ